MRAFSCSPQAIILATPARRIVAANTAAAQLLGYSETELAKLGIQDVYADQEDFRRGGEVVHKTKIESFVATLRKKSGQLFDASVSVRPILDAHEDVCGLIEVLEPAIGAEVSGAPTHSEANSSARRLTRGMAHDFNNLLAIIGGNIQLVADKAANARVKGLLSEAEQACQMAARMTRKLTEFASDSRLSPSTIVIKAMFYELVPILRRSVGEKISIEVRIEDGVDSIFVDQSALENALLNLVINARDAMPSGGAITLSARNMHPNELNDDRYVCIAVIDTGTGMTPRVLDRAFDPFFTTKTPDRGAGMGLASVYGFAKQSGGEAKIKSTLGQGTTVSIVLPAAERS